MKCPIILDLLPLYEERICSEETKKFVIKHLKECASCKNMYTEMKLSINKKSLDEEKLLDEMQKRDEDFWYKYYQKLVVKGVILYFTVYFSITLMGFIIKEFLK